MPETAEQIGCPACGTLMDKEANAQCGSCGLKWSDSALADLYDIKNWWTALGTHGQCIAVANVGVEQYWSPRDFAYNISKPWKWMVEAWKLAHNVELE